MKIRSLALFVVSFALTLSFFSSATTPAFADEPKAVIKVPLTGGGNTPVTQNSAGQPKKQAATVNKDVINNTDLSGGLSNGGTFKIIKPPTFTLLNSLSQNVEDYGVFLVNTGNLAKTTSVLHFYGLLKNVKYSQLPAINGRKIGMWVEGWEQPGTAADSKIWKRSPIPVSCQPMPGGSAFTCTITLGDFANAIGSGNEKDDANDFMAKYDAYDESKKFYFGTDAANGQSLNRSPFLTYASLRNAFSNAGAITNNVPAKWVGTLISQDPADYAAVLPAICNNSNPPLSVKDSDPVIFYGMLPEGVNFAKLPKDALDLWRTAPVQNVPLHAQCDALMSGLAFKCTVNAGPLAKVFNNDAGGIGMMFAGQSGNDWGVAFGIAGGPIGDAILLKQLVANGKIDANADCIPDKWEALQISNSQPKGNMIQQ